MMSDTDTLAFLNQLSNGIDPLVADCPRCGGMVRIEFKIEWRPIAEAARLYGVSVGVVRQSGAVVSPLGLVKSGVPYGTCMDCGTGFDLTAYPGATGSGGEGRD